MPLMPHTLTPRTILIIYPHWHPVNLAGVHRPRLVGNYLRDFGWKPRVLTVNESCFEELPDPDLAQTFSPDFEVTRVNAFRVTRPRIIGDIGLRAFFQIRRKAIQLCREERIDFIWIPIPSFYTALIGRILYSKTRTPYGIDYIDPWVRDISNRRSLRAIFSQWVARILEPIAVKKAALFTGVSEAYYQPVINRNKLLSRKPPLPLVHAAFPYGFDPRDHQIRIKNLLYPWEKTNKKIWLYAGAFLPKSHLFINSLFKVISTLQQNGNIEASPDFLLYFIGTGHYPYKSIEQYANDHGIKNRVVEIRERFPYLQTLNFLSEVDTVMIIGSTEEHYTASKTYQALLSGTPVFSIFHELSQACQVMDECHANLFTIKYTPSMSDAELEDKTREMLLKRISGPEWNPHLDKLTRYNAKAGAKILTEAIAKCLEKAD